MKFLQGVVVTAPGLHVIILTMYLVMRVKLAVQAINETVGNVLAQFAPPETP